jgi:hypothetical protein
MSKVGRNDPCPCGSGKKYKHCHLPIEQAAEAERRALRQAQDTLFPKLVAAAEARPEMFPEAMQQFWDGRYSVDQLGEIDNEEPRGAERFLTWLIFDFKLPDRRTLAATLADSPEELELEPQEARLLQDWRAVYMRPFLIVDRLKGQELIVRDMLDETRYRVIDHAASRRLELGEVIVGHLVPVAEEYYIGGAAAHLTEDTADKLAEFARLHLEAFRRDNPDATASDLLQDRSQVLNHFVMQLPSEAPVPGLMDEILLKTRTALALAGGSQEGEGKGEGGEPQAGA